jgi:serine/threonine protein kinase
MDRDDMIGATLGNYRVTKKLGQGGMGAVYLAEHLVLGRPAAIKVLLAALSQQRDLVQRFFHEARTTAQLRHPALVDVFDFGTTNDGRAYLVMDFLEGESLETRVQRQGPLPWSTALRIAREIALGVSVAHAEQIVHRDLKPDNVFLLPPIAGNPDERVKILDFGIAKLGRNTGEAAMTRAGMLIGTPLYMSPEQCRGAHEVDHRADVYSLGCILFTMLAGRPPFLSEAAGELIGLHQLAAPPTLASLGVQVPHPIEQLMTRMLAKAPEARFESMGQVAELCATILNGGNPVMPVATEGAGPGATMALLAPSPDPTRIFLSGPSAAAGGTNLLSSEVRLTTLSGAAVVTETPARGPASAGHKVTVVAVAVALVALAAGLLLFTRGLPGGKSRSVAAGPAALTVPVSAAPTAKPPEPVPVATVAPVRPNPLPPPQETTTIPELAKPPAPAAAKPPGRKRPSESRPVVTQQSVPAGPAPGEAPPPVAPEPPETPGAGGAASRPGRPVYRATKLNIETKAPY